MPRSRRKKRTNSTSTYPQGPKREDSKLPLDDHIQIGPLPFLRFAPEIRLQIYEYLFVQHTPILPLRTVHGPGCARPPCKRLSESITLLRVSKLVHEEAVQIVYSHNHFSLGSSKNQDIISWLERIGKNRFFLRTLEVNFDYAVTAYTEKSGIDHSMWAYVNRPQMTKYKKLPRQLKRREALEIDLICTILTMFQTLRRLNQLRTKLPSRIWPTHLQPIERINEEHKLFFASSYMISYQDKLYQHFSQLDQLTYLEIDGPASMRDFITIALKMEVETCTFMIDRGHVNESMMEEAEQNGWKRTIDETNGTLKGILWHGSRVPEKQA